MRDWLAGLVVGAAAGFLLAALPTLGAVLVFAFAVAALLSRTRVAALGGLLVGMPAVWLTVIGVAAARCAAFDAQPGQECAMGDVWGWVAIAVGLLAMGLVLTMRSMHTAAGPR
jgi:hypothetical protein